MPTRDMTATRHETTVLAPLVAPVLTFDIPTLLMRVKSEETWRSGYRDAITLLKDSSLRLVFVLMHPNRVIPMHQTEGPLVFQVVEGRVRFTMDSRQLVLSQGQVLTLQSGVRHTIESLEESAFLLTLVTGRAHPAEH